MMRLLRYGLLLMLFVLPGTANQQNDIKRKDQQLKRLRAEIAQYEQQIADSEQKEKATLSRLDIIEQKANLVRTLLDGLRDEEQLIRGSIETSRDNVGKLEKQLTFLKNHYAHYVSSV